MEAYTSFAQVYDLFMDNVPYENWAAWIKETLQEEGISDGLLLDLGCGTGKLTRLMAESGYDMIGVDLSYEMLELAREAEYDRLYPEDDDFDLEPCGKSQILYLEQDMREFELYGTVRAIYSACNSMNYLMEEDDILKVLKLANNYLDPGGLFIFDLNTPYRYEKVMGNRTFAESREDSSFIWYNFYDEDQRINEYDLTIFCKEEDGRFARFQEQHYQKSYTLETIKKLIDKAGMEFVGVYDSYTKEALRKDSEIMTIVCKEKHQDGKLYV